MSDQPDLNDPNLARVSDSTQVGISNPPWQELRERKVFDVGGEEIGELIDLYIDVSRKKIRYLVVISGGWIGKLGADYHTIPVEQVVEYDEDQIVVDRSRAQAEGVGKLDPEVLQY
jgi:sporulation protein YlmC with PRC-barrel domain